MTPDSNAIDSKPPSSPLESRLSLAASAVTTAVGLAVTLGWIADVDALRRFLPGVTNPMVGTTAACFIALGTALGLIRKAQVSSAQSRVAQGLAAAVVAVGVLVLGAYAFGWETGLDRFLYRDSALPFTGAMAVPTAISFVFMGASLIALASNNHRAGEIGQALALIAGIAPLLALVGRAYGVPALSSFVSGTVVMALHTALTFMILIVGTLAARPGVGVTRMFSQRDPGGWLLRALLLPAWAVVLLVGLLRLLGERAGYYGTEFGASLFAVATILLLSALLLLGARSLNRTESQRRRAEGQLLESELRGQAVLASLGEGVLTVDERGVITSVNPAIERMTGWTPNELLGRLYAEALPLRDRSGNPVPPEARLLSLAMVRRDVLVSRGYETTIETKDGRHVPVSITAAPLYDSDGNTVGGVDVIRDMSHEHEVDVMKSSLISTVSHELRTPLTMITGFSELLLSRDLDADRAKHAAGQIHDSALRLDRLVEDLLSVSRIDSGSLEVRLEKIELSSVIGDVAEGFASERAIEVEVAGGTEVLADRDMLHRILTNLVSNAVKYSPGGGAVTISAKREGAAATISVSDTGIGMTPEELSRLFQKFFRADQPEVRNARGTGLGLYITRKLVELQGGTIVVRSTRGEGTTFTFTLPLTKERVSL